MLDKTDDISVAADHWLAQFEDALAKSDAWRAGRAVPSRQLLARRAGVELEHPDRQRKRCHPGELKVHAASAAPQRPCGRPRSPRAAPGDARRHQRHRGDLQVRDRIGRGSGIIRLIPDACRRQPAEGLDATDRARRTQRLRRALGIERPRGNAYSRDFRGPNWLDLRKASAEYADRDPDRAGDRRRPGRALHCGAAEAVAMSTR